MSEFGRVTDDHDCSGDAAAYALGSLEPAEAEAFRRHLEECVVCRDELAAFGRVVDVLPMAVPQYEAPSGLRRRVLRAAREGGHDTQAEGARGFRLRRAIPRPRLALAGGTLGAVAAAAVIAVVLATSGSSGTRVITAAVTGPGSAEVRVSGGRAELILHGFPAPPAGHIYEVWLQRGTAAPSPTRTLFSVTGQGGADVGVTGSLNGVSRVMVTPEPAGGSQTPTHAPVIVARID